MELGVILRNHGVQQILLLHVIEVGLAFSIHPPRQLIHGCWQHGADGA